MKRLILALLILTTTAVQAFELNGKKWAEDKARVFVPKSFNEPLMRKRMEIIRDQFREVVPFKISVRYHDLPDDTDQDILNLLAFAQQHNVIIVLQEEGRDYGLGNRLANASFITSNGGTMVHGGLVRFNDIRLEQVAGGARPNYKRNYIANVTWHEVGHLFGLDHADQNTSPKSIMVSGGKFSRLKNIGLAPDDKKGLRRIYK